VFCFKTVWKKSGQRFVLVRACKIMSKQKEKVKREKGGQGGCGRDRLQTCPKILPIWLARPVRLPNK
jgi:hypothetical protein